MTPTRLLISQCHSLNATYQVRERRVDQQVAQRITVRGGYQLHTAFRDGARGGGFQFSTNFVDYDDLRHMVFHRLDHHRVLLSCASYLHTARSSDASSGANSGSSFTRSAVMMPSGRQ